jgi:hypothetical protein
MEVLRSFAQILFGAETGFVLSPVIDANKINAKLKFT